MRMYSKMYSKMLFMVMQKNFYKPLSQLNKAHIQLGGVTERLNVPVLKTGEGATLPWVRIPPPPPYYNY